MIPTGSVIITKLDSHPMGGGAISAVAATKTPIIFIGTGEHYEDFDEFNAQSFVRRLLEIGDMFNLNHRIEEDNTVICSYPGQRFTIRDMYEQYQNIMKIGSLGKVISIMPGFGQDFLPNEKDKEQETFASIKEFMVIINSMTNEEMDATNLKMMVPSRIARIARGSGNSIADVNSFLEKFTLVQKTIFKNHKDVKFKKNLQMDMRN